MNKLRALSISSAGILAGAVVWAFLAYNGLATPVPYVSAMGIVLLILTLPGAAAHAKLIGRRAARHWKGPSEFSDERGTIFRSASEMEREDLFAVVEDIVVDSPKFDDVWADEFSEGTGLVVSYANFHTLFVRVTDEGHPVISGASKRSRQLVDHLERTCSIAFEQVETSPFLDHEPVRGAPRVVLATTLIVAMGGGFAVVANAAYSTGTYNTAEKATLMGMDARAAVDPDVSDTDLKLQKADFLVDSLREEAVEIYWSNGTGEVHTNAVQALRTDEDVRELLRSAQSDSLTDEQAARADRIESDLHEADRSVADAIANRTENGVEDPDGDLEDTRQRLLNASETPVGAS